MEILYRSCTERIGKLPSGELTTSVTKVQVFATFNGGGLFVKIQAKTVMIKKDGMVR